MTEVRRELKRLGLPDLGQKTEAGTPYSKKRQKAEAAMARMKKAKARNAGAGARSGAPIKAKVSKVCRKCFLELPATGKCDACA